MEFMHCNGCGHYPKLSDTRRRYFISSCGHVLCDACCNKIQEAGGTCPICSSKARVVEINGTAPQDIQNYFMDPNEIFKESSRRLMQVMQFQRSQQKSFNQLFEKVIQGQSVLARDLHSSRLENAELKRRIESYVQKEQAWMGTAHKDGNSNLAQGQFLGQRGTKSGGGNSSSFIANASVDSDLNSIFGTEQRMQIRTPFSTMGARGSPSSTSLTPTPANSWSPGGSSIGSGNENHVGYGQGRITRPITTINTRGFGSHQHQHQQQFSPNPPGAGKIGIGIRGSDILARLKELKCGSGRPPNIK